MTDRPRWNDQAVDGLAEQVSDLEDQYTALHLLPERVAGLKELMESQHKETQRRFDRIDEAHEKAGRSDRATIVIAAIAAMAPMGAAYLTVNALG